LVRHASNITEIVITEMLLSSVRSFKNWYRQGKISSYTGWLIKTSPIFCLRKDTYSTEFRRLYPGNDLYKTIIRHTAQKRRYIFYDRTVLNS